MTGGAGGAVDEMAAWTLMQATADVARAEAAGVFVSYRHREGWKEECKP